MTAGKPVHRPIGAVLHVDGGQRTPGAGGDFLGRIAVILGSKGYIGPHGGHKKLAVGILEDVPDFSAYLRQIFAFHRQTAHGQCPRLYRQDAHKDFQQRGFAHTVAAHQPNALARRDGKGQRVQHFLPGQPALIPEGEVLQF